METLWQDLRYAVRTLMKNLAFTAVAVLVLALGVGATTAVFSVVNAVLLRPLPYKNPSQLVAITSVYQPTRAKRVSAAIVGTDMDEWRKRAHSFDSMAAFTFTQLPIKMGGQAFSPVTALLDPVFLPTLGIVPAIGRNFSVAPSPAAEASVIISRKLWVEAFQGDPSAVGRPVVVDGDLYTLIGILPATFQFPRSDASYSSQEPDLLLTAASFTNFPKASRNWFGIGRLRSGIKLAQAQAEMVALAAGLAEKTPEDRDWSVRLAPLGEETARSARPALLIVLGISVVLLLIAGGNLMNLLLSRAAAREREIAIRKAVGATTGRLIRQMLTESACLAALGGVGGIAIASWAIDVLAGLSPVHLPVTETIRIDGVVLAFTFAICAAVALVTGLFPALHITRQGGQLLRSAGTRSGGSQTLARAQRVLCIAQMALGLGLLSAAGLLTHSLWRLSSLDPGFRRQNVLGFSLTVPDDHTLAQRLQFFQQALDQVRGIPGVASAGWITFLPPETRAGDFTRFSIDAPPDAEKSPAGGTCNFMITSADYFSTVGIPLLGGRGISAEDTAQHPPVIVINETFARKYFPGGDAIGRKIYTGGMAGTAPREIAGIVKDARDRGLGEKIVATSYIPFTQFALSYASMAVRTQVPLKTLVPEIRTRISKLDSSIPLTDFQTIDDRIYKSLEEPRFYTLMACACALMAVLFVTLGLYGIVSYSVSRRTSEFGIRMAIGAQRRTILQMVLRQGLQMAAAGVVIGVILSLACTRVLSSLLFEVKPNDPASLAAAAVLVVGVTLAASYIPARRASRVDPIVALRYE